MKKNISLLMIFFTVSFSRFAPSRACVSVRGYAAMSNSHRTCTMGQLVICICCQMPWDAQPGAQVVRVDADRPLRCWRPTVVSARILSVKVRFYTILSCGFITLPNSKHILGVLSHHLKCEMKSLRLVDFSWDFVDFQSNLSQILTNV